MSETTAPQQTANVIYLDNSQRRQERLTTGLDAEWRGRKLEVVNWAVGGIGLIYPGCPWGLHERIDLTLIIQLSDGSLPVQATAILVHSNPDSHYIGLRFVDMRESSSLIIAEAFRAMQLKQPLNLPMLFDAAQQQLPFDSDFVPWNHVTPDTGRDRFWRGISMAALFCLAAILVYFGLRLVHLQFFTLSAPYAAVAAPSVTLTAPANGIVQYIPDAAAKEFAAGTPLMRIVPLGSEDKLSDADALLLSQRRRVAVLRAAANAETGYKEQAEKLLSSQRQAGLAAVEAAKARRDEAANTLNRTEELITSGTLPAKQRDSAKANLAAANAELRKAEAVARAVPTAPGLSVEFDLPQGRNRTATSGSAAAALAMAEAELARLETTFNRLSKNAGGIAVASPCDCTLERLFVGSGRYVEAGTTLLSLNPSGSGVTRAVAKVPQDSVQHFTGTVRADVRVLGTDTVISGRVSRIERLQDAQNGTLLPAVVDSDPRLATVYVELDHALPAEHSGLPAEVVFDFTGANPILKFLPSF
ncbi:MAG: HlyD family efflux transporter periplasmic adaptor subunit [Holosporales bacterium]